MPWPALDVLAAVVHHLAQHGGPLTRPTPERIDQAAHLEPGKFYRDEQHWSAGPHLFIDDKQIWVFTPLTVSGVHSPSWNKTALGIEMLGDYDKEAFNSGRGLQVQKNAVAAIATLSAVLGFNPETMKLHREDPLTTHACPGRNVNKTVFIQAVKDLMAARHGGEHAVAASITAPEQAMAAPPPRKRPRPRRAGPTRRPGTRKKASTLKRRRTARK